MKDRILKSLRTSISKVKEENLTFLILLILIDIAFIGIHVVYMTTDRLESPFFSIEKDRGYAEIFQYVKEFWIVVMLFVMAISKSSLTHLIWCGAFAFLLFDDAFRVHERLGMFLGEKLGFGSMYGMLPKDFGELIVYFVIGTTIAACLGFAYYKGKQRHFSNYMFVMSSVFVFFGVFVDMIHTMVANPTLYFLLGTIEDGGEMVVISVITWFIFHFFSKENWSYMD